MKKISTYCMAATLAIATAVAFSAGCSSSASQTVDMTEVRPATPFVVLTAVGVDQGKAKIGLDDYTINVAFDYQVGEIKDRISGEKYIEVEVTSIHDVIVKDLNGKPVNDFTDYQDHQQFAAMIRHKLMEY